MTDKKKPDTPETLAENALDKVEGGAVGSLPTDELAKRGFNPQPEPPRTSFGKVTRRGVRR